MEFLRHTVSIMKMTNDLIIITINNNDKYIASYRFKILNKNKVIVELALQE